MVPQIVQKSSETSPAISKPAHLKKLSPAVREETPAGGEEEGKELGWVR